MKTEIKTNADKVARNLKEMPGRLHSGLDKQMKAATKMLVKEIKERISGDILKIRSGKLRDSINQRVDRETNKIIGRVGTNLIYARTHEYGATIKAKNKPYLVFPISEYDTAKKRFTGPGLTKAGLRSYSKKAKKGGQWVKVKQVKIPARQPFKKSFDNKFEAMRERLNVAVKEVFIGKE